MKRATRAGHAHAKINLALVVGSLRPDGKHEVATVLQRVELADRIELTAADELRVDGFPEDTIVRDALSKLAARAGLRPAWRVRIEKRIPVAAGLGGGSSDAATALRLANATLAEPLPETELASVAAAVGADVPFFLRCGPQLGTADGTELRRLQLPQSYAVALVVPHGEEKQSTAAIYRRFDERRGEVGFAERRTALLDLLDGITTPDGFARLPRNDLASSPLCRRLEQLGAFHADVSGAGPAVYGLFHRRDEALAAARSMRALGRAVVTTPTC